MRAAGLLCLCFAVIVMGFADAEEGLGSYPASYPASSSVEKKEYILSESTYKDYLEWPDRYFSRRYGYGKTFMRPTDDFSYDLLEKLIKEGGHQSVESTLEAIKNMYPSSLSKYVIMYESRSLQKASPENPRILSLAGSKEMVFSFNGHPDQRGYSQLEVMQFLPDENKFEFREITFQAGAPAIFSEPNPAKCMNCHQADWRRQPTQNDPRPNWEPYNTWPGAIGSLDGDLKKYTVNHRLDSDQDRHLLAKHEQEKVWLYNWIFNIKDEHPRYKHLGEFQGPKTVLEFTKNMAVLNAYRLGRIITSLPQDIYQAVLPSLILITNKRCDYSFLPRPVPKYQSMRPYAVSMSQELDAIFEPLGIQTEDWSMDFRTGGRLSADSRIDRLRNPHSVEPFMAMGLEKYDPENFSVQAADYEVQGSSSLMMNARAQCDEAFAREAEMRPIYESFVTNGGFTLPQQFQKTKLIKPLMERCVSCHSDDIAEIDDSIPFLPFDRPERLATLLNQGEYPRGTLLDEIKYRTGEYAHSSERMPKGHMPSLQSVEGLIDYLEGLSEQ
jgi:hypothetical protein